MLKNDENINLNDERTFKTTLKSYCIKNKKTKYWVVFHCFNLRNEIHTYTRRWELARRSILIKQTKRDPVDGCLRRTRVFRANRSACLLEIGQYPQTTAPTISVRKFVVPDVTTHVNALIGIDPLLWPERTWKPQARNYPGIIKTRGIGTYKKNVKRGLITTRISTLHPYKNLDLWRKEQHIIIIF